MTEAIFPLLGSAVLVLAVLPFFALFTKAVLSMMERSAVGGPLHGLHVRYLLLTASSVLPLSWFFSAAVHQAESGKSALACLVDHDGAAACWEPGIFAFLLALGMWVAWRRSLRTATQLSASASPTARALAGRLDALIESRPALGALRRRLFVTDDSAFTLGTYGLFRPRVFVGSRFAEHVTDAMLTSALAHELEHVRSLNPLRYLLLEFALCINPFGRFLLEPHAARWRAAREAHCDREAVLQGAAPLALADAIVRAARPLHRATAGLGTSDTAVLRFRINLLLAFAERPPHRCCQQDRSAVFVAVTLLFITLWLPHRTGTEALDVLHVGTEQALTYLLD